MNIRARLLAVLILSALVPLYLVGWLALERNAASRAEAEDAGLLARANGLAADVEGFIRGSLDALRADAGLPVFPAYLAADSRGRASRAIELRNSLRRVAAKDPVHVMSAALLDRAGQVLADTALATSTGLSEADNPCFAQALESGLSILRGPRYTARYRAPFIFACHPVRDERGQIVGVLRLRVSAARLQAIVWRGALTDESPRGLLLLASDGVVLAHSARPAWQLRARVGGDAASDARLRSEGRLAPDGQIVRLPGEGAALQGAAALVWAELAGERHRAARVPVHGSEWQAVVHEPESAWYAESAAESRTMMALGAVLTLLLVLAAWVAAARIAQPIVRLTALADRIGLEGPRPSLPVDAGGEVGRLARAMQAMTVRLEDTLAQLAEQVREQRATAQRLAVSESRFAALFNLSPLPLLLTEQSEGRVLALNASFVAQFGAEAAQIEGQTLAALVADPRYPRLDLLAGKLAASGDVDECVALGAQPTQCSLRVFGRAFDAGERHLLVWTFVDVTEAEQARQALQALNASLEARVDQRTAELRETLARLQRTQDELVRSEKLAALGALVAGVAHELNTPIGNAVTVASTIEELTARLTEDVLTGSLRRSTLDTFLGSMRHAADLLTRNLERTRALVASFRQMAVQRATDRRQIFDLDEVIRELVATLTQALKDAPARIELDLISVRMDAYRGPIEQILTHLIENAMLHAFAGRKDGCVTISLSQHADASVRLCCRDDGCGMDEETQRRIFDPFFTTRFGRGGSGLGMHVVYTLVTQTLGGHIEVSSTPGAGSCFTISLPLVAPQASD